MLETNQGTWDFSGFRFMGILVNNSLGCFIERGNSGIDKKEFTATSKLSKTNEKYVQHNNSIVIHSLH